VFGVTFSDLKKQYIIYYCKNSVRFVSNIKLYFLLMDTIKLSLISVYYMCVDSPDDDDDGRGFSVNPT
jgi:hypothetical protein